MSDLFRPISREQLARWLFGELESAARCFDWLLEIAPESEELVELARSGQYNAVFLVESGSDIGAAILWELPHRKASPGDVSAASLAEIERLDDDIPVTSSKLEDQ